MIKYIKYLVLFTACLSFSLQGRAQTASWQKRPGWSEAQVLSSSVLRVKQDGKYGLVRWDGFELTPCQYDEITYVQEGRCLLLSKENGELRIKGIVDADTGSIIVPKGNYSVDSLWPYFSEGLLAVKSGNKWGYLAPDGSLSIPCQYRLALPFSFGLASVCFNDGYFGHIDQRQVVSYGKGRLESNDFIFASTFVQTDDGPMALVVTRDAFIGRNLSGNVVKPLLPLNERLSSFTQTIKTRDFTLEFNNAWQPARVQAGNAVRNYGAAKAPESFKPSVPTISSQLEQGLYNLYLNGTRFLPGQFDDLIPLSEALVLVQFHKEWGILSLHPFENIVLSPKEQRLSYSHGSPVVFALDVTLPPSLQDKPFFLQNDQVSGQGPYQFIIPVNSTDSIELGIQADGLSYPNRVFPLKWNFEKGFAVAIPSQVQLSERETAVLTITITNNTGTASLPSDIYVDRNYISTLRSLAPFEKITVSVPMTLSLGDEDSVSSVVNVEIRETNCPPVRASQNVVYTRYFKE